MHVFESKDRYYSEWSFDPPYQGTCDPIRMRLYTGDAITSDGKPCFQSPYRKNRSIPGVLCLSGGTHGRKKGRQLFRCVPADRRLPVFLVPYTHKHAEFSKNPVDKYILFEIAEWDGKHPYGSSTNTLGPVSDLTATYAYLLHAANLHYPVQRLTKAAFHALRSIVPGAKGTQEGVAVLEEELRSKHVGIPGDRWGEAYTIDPEGAKDLDDAISISPVSCETGMTSVSVYIADPGYWVERLGLWSYLTDRTATVYLPDGKRPMLPASCMSDGVCSLLSGRARACLVLHCTLDSDGCCVEEEFEWGWCVVKRNMTYEQMDLEKSDDYMRLLNITRLACAVDPLIETIVDSHEVVAYWMLKFNLVAGTALRKTTAGIYRYSARPMVSRVPDDVPEETARICRYWGTSGAQYGTQETSLPHAGIGKGDRFYAQASSPIRRIVDMVNMTLLIRGITSGRAVSREEKAHAMQWLSRVDKIQMDSKSAKRLQSNCELLERCVKAKEDGEDVFWGYPIALEPDSNGTSTSNGTSDIAQRRYVVHIPGLKYLARVETDREWDLFQKKRFSLHMFLDESVMHKKVRLSESEA